MSHISFLVTLFLAVTLVSAQIQIPNINYGDGTYPAQNLDLYLPYNEVGRVTKVIVLIHGGAGGAGEKSDMDVWAVFMQASFPTHAIANMEYRLGTHDYPGFPKQLEDIYLAVTFLKSSFDEEVTFALIGASAGGHLAMLYAYSMDSTTKNVKVVVSQVGPTDITDLSYTESENPIYRDLFFDLVGPCVYAHCPHMYNYSSPLTYVTPEACKTIGFYGDNDPLVPNTQLPLLKNKLDEFGIPNNFTFYQGGHGDWVWEDAQDMISQIEDFFNTHWQ